jgi:hypothetical protein
MAESGKSKWFHKLEPKSSSKHQNGIIGPVEHIRENGLRIRTQPG